MNHMMLRTRKYVEILEECAWFKQHKPTFISIGLSHYNFWSYCKGHSKKLIRNFIHHKHLCFNILMRICHISGNNILSCCPLFWYNLVHLCLVICSSIPPFLFEQEYFTPIPQKSPETTNYNSERWHIGQKSHPMIFKSLPCTKQRQKIREHYMFNMTQYIVTAKPFRGERFLDIKMSTMHITSSTGYINSWSF